MPQKFGIRDLGILIHRWTGLLIAAFLIIVGLTGSILAIEGPIDRWLNPELHVSRPPNASPVDLATLAERAEASDPHLRVAYFWAEDDQVHVMVGGKKDPASGKPYDLGYSQLILDPWSGAVLGRAVMEGQWMEPGPWRQRVLPFVYSLHTSLATGTTTGWTFMGIIALLWTLDCFVAFYVTLPRSAGPFWRRWQQAWKIKWNANSARVHFDLHRAGGLWLWPLLFVFGWSSVMFGLTQVYEPVMKHLFDFVSMSESLAQNSLPKPLDTPALTWRQAQQAGERAMAEQAALHHFTVERPYGMAYVADYGAYTYAVRSSLDFRGHGWDTTVLVDGNSGELRSVDLARGQHLGNSISALLWGIHFADLRDWLTYRIFVCLFGVFLSTISYTGVYIWWKKRTVRQFSTSRSLSKVIRATGFVLLLTALVACNRTKKYPLQGEIVSKSVATSEITVNHSDIPGFMPAMAMPYHVKDPAVIQELQPGDKIAAEAFVSKSGDYWLDDVRITDESKRAQVKTPVTPHMLIPGERVPNMAFVNQDGRTIHLSDFAGKALLVTFIYTRCPMPNFCPRLSSQFAKIHDELKKSPGDYSKTHLLTISFDPKYDTPPVLRKYGLAYLDDDASGFSQWDFASTNPTDMARIAQAFGLEYQEEDNQISHTMNIVLIGPDGTVAKLWSTDWTWTELMESMQQTLHSSEQSSEIHGRALYGYLCASCHEVPNQELRKQPPNLHGIFLAKSLPSGASATDEQVHHTIISGLRTMPAFNQFVSDADADDIVQYLHRLH